MLENIMSTPPFLLSHHQMLIKCRRCHLIVSWLVAEIGKLTPNIDWSAWWDWWYRHIIIHYAFWSWKQANILRDRQIDTLLDCQRSSDSKRRAQTNGHNQFYYLPASPWIISVLAIHRCVQQIESVVIGKNHGHLLIESAQHSLHSEQFPQRKK